MCNFMSNNPTNCCKIQISWAKTNAAYYSLGKSNQCLYVPCTYRSAEKKGFWRTAAGNSANDNFKIQDKFLKNT